MTDTSSIFTTNSTPHLNPVTAPSLASPVINGSLSDTIPAEEDEPYTIKCICDFQDDDGNTVFCEKCETWQHIECYYHGKKVPDVHNCVDCEPRPLAGKRATERQRKLREQGDGGDRKAKRATSKSHKKKVKDVDAVNGWHSHERLPSLSASRDQPPPQKRSKTSHRPSASVSSINGATVLTSDSRKRAHSSAQGYPSPTKSPSNGPILPQYTPEFLHLYDDDQGKENLSMRDNFNTISVTRKLKSWLHEPLELSQDSNGRSFHEVFIESDAPLETSAFPPVSLHTVTNPECEMDGRHPSWKLLKLDADVRRDELVGEIKGSVGLLRDYCLDEANRWQELRHPEPFVFFHPQLPIYIDSRREGTKFRYLRRSCRPNVTMKTFIDSEGEYHYCFVAKDDIPAGVELTATWYLDQAVLNRGQIKEETPTDGEFELPPPWIWASRVLANFGDCACDAHQQTCMLAPLDRRRLPRIADAPMSKLPNGKKRRATKIKHMSPPVNGTGSVSRAGSETVKGMEDDDQAESRSTSESIRSKPQSRDMTPTNSTDATATDGLTDRERRKIAAAEKTFERLEQGHHEKKKKKRSSAGSTLNTPNLNTSRQLGNGSQSASPSVANKPSYVDAGTSRQHSESPPAVSTDFRKAPGANPRQMSTPSTPVLPSPLHRPTYTDMAVQTDDDNLTAQVPPNKRRRFSTMTQRMLKKCHEDRLKYEEMERRRTSFSAGYTLPSPVSPSTSSDTAAPSAPIQRDNLATDDTEMKDVSSAAAGSSPLTTSSPLGGLPTGTMETSSLPPPPLPSQAAHTRKALQPPNGQRLQISNLPPVPVFSAVGSTVTPSAGTPNIPNQSPFNLGSATSSVNLSPSTTAPVLGPALTAPNPVKKKLSLGDYMSRRNATPVVEKTQAQSLATSSSASDLGVSVSNEEKEVADGTFVENTAAELGSMYVSVVSMSPHDALEAEPSSATGDVSMKDNVGEEVGPGITASETPANPAIDGQSGSETAETSVVP